MSHGFKRIHRSYTVNLNRVREMRLRRGDPNDWELKRVPPVNKVLPLNRASARALQDLLIVGT